MNCGIIQDLLPLYHDGVCSPESRTEVEEHLKTCPDCRAALAAMERRGVRKGIALRPITAAEAVLPYLDKVDLILVMTVEPGFGGQAFMADQLPKIAAIRRYIQERNPACRLEVDGGVDPVTARQVVEAGADVLVAGSAIYGAPDPAQAIRALRGE